MYEIAGISCVISSNDRGYCVVSPHVDCGLRLVLLYCWSLVAVDTRLLRTWMGPVAVVSLVTAGTR